MMFMKSMDDVIGRGLDCGGKVKLVRGCEKKNLRGGVDRCCRSGMQILRLCALSPPCPYCSVFSRLVCDNT